MKTLASFAVFTSLVVALVLAVNPNLFGECKHETTYNQFCPDPATTTDCKDAQPPCPNSKGQLRATGEFGCQDNGTKMTQCLDADVLLKDSMVLCYREWTCSALGAGCQIDSATETKHYKLKKVEKPCAGS